MARTLAKIIVGLLSFWAVCTVIAELMGVTIYFPFNIIEKQDLTLSTKGKDMNFKSNVHSLDQLIKSEIKNTS